MKKNKVKEKITTIMVKEATAEKFNEVQKMMRVDLGGEDITKEQVINVLIDKFLADKK